MMNLYRVTVSGMDGEKAVNVLAVTDKAAIRKALKAIYGAVSAAPSRSTYSAKLTAADVIC